MEGEIFERKSHEQSIPADWVKGVSLHSAVLKVWRKIISDLSETGWIYLLLVLFFQVSGRSSKQVWEQVWTVAKQLQVMAWSKFANWCKTNFMNLPSALVGWSKNASFVFDWVRNDGDVVNSVSHNGPGFPTLVAIPLCEKLKFWS